MAYNVLNLTSRVRRKLKDNSYSASDILDFLNDAQVEIATLFAWSYFETVTSDTLTISSHTKTQQSDHQTTNKLLLIHPTESTNYRLMDDYYLPYEEFFERFPVPDAQPSGFPQWWTEYGDKVYFNCPADIAYKFRQYYMRTPTELEDNADVPDLPVEFREALVLGATYRAEQQRDNYDYAAVVEQKFLDKVGDLITRYANRQNVTSEVTILGAR